MEDVDVVEMIERETAKRVQSYHDLGPGRPGFGVHPMTASAIVPALLTGIGFTILLIYGALAILPRYYP